MLWCIVHEARLELRSGRVFPGPPQEDDDCGRRQLDGMGMSGGLRGLFMRGHPPGPLMSFLRHLQRGVQCCGRERAQDSQAVPRPSHHSAHPPVQSGAPD
ncbi:hypothetical protein ACKKBF_B39855 [Auxenochlorella protothecoides x Auxenochlorella symbiontica]